MGEFTEAGRRLIEGAKAGLYQTGIDIMFLSQIEVPVDTGTLKGSARVNEPEEYVDRVVCTIGYGYGEEINPKTGERAIQYALPVHEILEASHKPPTKAKFLEDPALAYEGAFEKTMAVWMSRAFKAEGDLVHFFELVKEPSPIVGGLEGVE